MSPVKDPADLERLWRVHAGDLMTYATSMLGSRSAAEDVVQETWIRAMRCEGILDWRGFLFTVASNLARNELRRRRRERAAFDRWAPTAPESVEVPDLERALARLSEEQREVFLLKAKFGMDYGSIAEVAGCPVATVRSRMFHAVRKLREALGAVSRGAP